MWESTFAKRLETKSVLDKTLRQTLRNKDSFRSVALERVYLLKPSNRTSIPDPRGVPRS